MSTIKGAGIQNNAQETASKVAKGFVKGTFDGIKESAKDLLPKKEVPAPAEAKAPAK